MSVPVSAALRQAFAPSGVLRVALNHGNRVLVARDAKGAPYGITVDLAQALAAALDLPLRFIHRDRAIDVSSAATDDLYDICFLAIDPERAKTLSFTPPYIIIEGRYLAGPECGAGTAQALVASGQPVGTVEGSAYTLDLERKAGAAQLVRYPDIAAALAALDRSEIAALAGIGKVMEVEAASRPGARVLDPPFMEIGQAIAMPAGRPDAMSFLSGFVADLARSGQLGEIFERHGVPASAAPVAG